MIEASATSKYIRTSAQKAGLVLDLIRGKDVNKALATLKFARKSVASITVALAARLQNNAEDPRIPTVTGQQPYSEKDGVVDGSVDVVLDHVTTSNGLEISPERIHSFHVS